MAQMAFEQDAISPRQPQALGLQGIDIGRTEENTGSDIHSYLTVLLRRRWLMLAVMVVVLAAGTLYTLTRQPVYESSARVVVIGLISPTPAQGDDIPLVAEVQALTRSRSVESQVEVISSPDILEQAFSSLDPQVRRSGFKSKILPDWACTVFSRRYTDVITITARAYTPAAAAALANAVVQSYFRRDLEQSNQATRQARKFAGERMASAERDLAYANQELADFKRRTGLIAPDTQVTRSAEQMAQLSVDLGAAQSEAAAARHEAAALYKEVARQRANVVASTTVTRNPEFESITDRIDRLTSERVTLLQEYTPESREVKSIEASIKGEQDKLKKVAQTIVGSTMEARNPVKDSLLPRYSENMALAAAANARAAAIKKQLAARQQQAQILPERERVYSLLLQRASTLQRTYDALSSKFYALLLSEQATIPNGMLVSKARPAKSASYPSKKSNVMLFTMLGALAALAAAFTAERLDHRVREQETVERATGLPILTLVPAVEDGPIRLAQGASNGVLLESYRILRHSIEFAGVGRQVKTIAVTSPGRLEGKSTTTVNLGVAMAMEGKRVLLVDGDMRRPSLHRQFGLGRGVGLTTAVMGASELEASVQRTRIENLFCLASGPTPPNPAEILNSAPSREAIRKLSEDYDVVLIDSPPSVGLSDIQVISTMVDGVLLVVSLDQSSKQQLDIAARVLARAGAPMLGAVINRADLRRMGYGCYYDYYNSDDSEDGTAMLAAGSGASEADMEGGGAR